MILAEEQPQLCSRYGILQAPTLTVEDASGCSMYAGIGEILRFISQAGSRAAGF